MASQPPPAASSPAALPSTASPFTSGTSAPGSPAAPILHRVLTRAQAQTLDARRGAGAGRTGRKRAFATLGAAARPSSSTPSSSAPPSAAPAARSAAAAAAAAASLAALLGRFSDEPIDEAALSPADVATLADLRRRFPGCVASVSLLRRAFFAHTSPPDLPLVLALTAAGPGEGREYGSERPARVHCRGYIDCVAPAWGSLGRAAWVEPSMLQDVLVNAKHGEWARTRLHWAALNDRAARAEELLAMAACDADARDLMAARRSTTRAFTATRPRPRPCSATRAPTSRRATTTACARWASRASTTTPRSSSCSCAAARPSTPTGLRAPRFTTRRRRATSASRGC